MNYARIYERLITRARQRALTGYSEVHHIVPKCLGGSNRKDNLVRLTAEEHVFAHRLLCRIHPHNTKLAYAVVLLVGSLYGRETRKAYAADKERVRLNRLAKQAAEDAAVIKLLNKRKSPTKSAHKSPTKLVDVPVYAREYPRYVKVGNRWVTNGVTSKHVKADEFEGYLAQGWVPGRRLK